MLYLKHHFLRPISLNHQLFLLQHLVFIGQQQLQGSLRAIVVLKVQLLLML
jgi:hypothetical protein